MSAILATDDGQLRVIGDLVIPGDKVGKLSNRLRIPTAAQNLMGTPHPMDELVVPQIPLATAQAQIAWKLNGNEQGDIAIRDIIQKNGASLNNFETIFHIRSFLARIGLDCEVLFIEYKNPKHTSAKKPQKFNKNRPPPPGEDLGTIICHLNLRFCVDTERDGKIVVPLYEALRTNQNVVKVGNLVIIPPDATPLSLEKFSEAVHKEQIFLPKGWKYQEDGSLVEIAITGGQYTTTPSLRVSNWSNFFSKGKRVLARLQKRLPVSDHFLKSPFDIWGIQVSAGVRGVQLVLGLNTTHENVFQTSSQWLDLPTVNKRKGSTEERHIELRVGQENIPVRNTRVLGRFFMPRTSVTVATEMSPIKPAAKISIHESNLTLDRALQCSEVKEALRLIEANCAEIPGKLRGVVVSQKSIKFIPFDRSNDIVAWADVAAGTTHNLDDRPLNVVSSDLKLQLLKHPGMKALMSTFVSRTSHIGTHLLISADMLSPAEVEELAITAGVGIGSFISMRLKQNSLHNEGGVPRLSASSLDQYRQLSNQGTADLYWLPATGEVRKLVGPTFVELHLEEFYSKMDFVLAVYLSHEDNVEISAPFKKQMNTFLEKLDGLGLDIGIACGNSSGLMKELVVLCAKRKHIQPIGISTIVTEAELNLAPGILTLCADDRRYPQRLLANIADARIALNGGIGTTAAASEDFLDLSQGNLLTGPLGIIDVAQIGNWSNWLEHMRGLETFGDSSKLAPAWAKNLLCDSKDLETFFTEVLRPFLNDPLRWAQDRQVPVEVQRAGMVKYLANTKFFGRKPAPFLHRALSHHSLKFEE